VSKVKAWIPEGKFRERLAEYFQPAGKEIIGVTGVGVGVGVGVPFPPPLDLEQEVNAMKRPTHEIKKYFFIRSYFL
jgi:hypothetical protein